MNRKSLLEKLAQQGDDIWDLLIIGGGATGLGIAVDSSNRGYKTLLLEQYDFAQGTSSRSTKLIHGGVRYLAQGDILLVMEGLHERTCMHRNAQHLTSNQEFIIPLYSWWEVIKYWIGLKLYDFLAGRMSMGKSHFIKKDQALKKLPTLRTSGLKGGVVYHDGQFDDARFAVALAETSIQKGGIALNYFKVTALLKNNLQKVIGVKATDLESGTEYSFFSKSIINATGVYTDDILKLDNPSIGKTIRPSQGVHLILKQSFLGGNSALMIPKTGDGRVLFAIPWYGKVVVGTTDTPVNEKVNEPIALEEEVQFILDTSGKYLSVPPQKSDILSVFAGLRPLAAPKSEKGKTKEISRRYKIIISPSGLISVLGGKWTIYRRMAQDTVNIAVKKASLEKRPCTTRNLSIYGSSNDNYDNRLKIYGNHAVDIMKMYSEDPDSSSPIHPEFPYTKAEIQWICRNEMPVILQDILARRTRALILNAKASKEMALEVATIMAKEFEKNDEWKLNQLENYNRLVECYLPSK